MTVLSASELKKRGISAVEDQLSKRDEATISVRGRAAYVVMKAERYEELLELELERAVAQAKEDYAKGRVRKESAKAHFKRLGI
jgi:PHD/YefM family antitoxin component YafN of YafNO toxin-antitoxin module